MFCCIVYSFYNINATICLITSYSYYNFEHVETCFRFGFMYFQIHFAEIIFPTISIITLVQELM